MNSDTSKTTAAQRYDKTLLGSQRRRKLPPDTPQPQPTSAWPQENITLLARYWVWLTEEDSTPECIENIYIPMAGHVLGLNLKPHAQLDLDSDLEKAMAYVRAKQLSNSWTDICLRALHRFRRFLRYERGLLEVSFANVDVCLDRYHAGLPDWFIEQITRLQHVRQVNWRQARLSDAIRRFWASHTRLWCWLFAQDGVSKPRHVKRHHILTYIDERLAAGYAAQSVNQDLRAFLATLRFLQEQGFRIPLSLLRLPMLKEPDSLPRFLTDAEVSRLQTHMEQRLTQANKAAERRSLLDRAIFYLLWHAGLRLGEVEELCLADLNISTKPVLSLPKGSMQVLGQQQLVVRQGKGMKDRTVYLTELASASLAEYLTVRGQGQTDHVFLFRHLALRKGFINYRFKLTRERTGIQVTPHQLRHTCATQLVNAGCPITTIKAILGHRRLNSTLVYARVHDRTVAEDYYAAMAVIEKRLTPHLQQSPIPQNGTVQSKNGSNSHQLLALVDALQEQGTDENQQQIVAELRQGIVQMTAQLERSQNMKRALSQTE